jgi:L-cystine uptake protein TcyP (sodium:dicarboxylate symporter family)
MLLTLNQVLLLVLTIAAVVGITVLVLFLLQLRKTAKEGEKTLVEFQTLARNLNMLSEKVNSKVDDLGELVDATRKTAVSMSEAAWFVTSKIIRPSSRIWPVLFPLVRVGWRRLKKKKEDKNGK